MRLKLNPVLAAGLLWLALLSVTFAGAPLELKFDAARNDRLGGAEAQLLPAPKDYTYRAIDDYLQIENRHNSLWCELALKLELNYRPDLVISFDYRNIAGNDRKFACTAINLYNGSGQSAYASAPPSAEWKHASFPFGKLRLSESKARFADNEPLTRLRIYSRLDNHGGPGKVKLEIKNISIAVDPAYDPLNDIRLSYSALPLFDWPDEKSEAGYLVEYSTDRNFPPAATTKIDVKYPFFVPSAPFSAGAIIHYRVTNRSTGKLILVDRLRVADPAHRWQLPRYDFASYAARPHPRFPALARYQQPDLEALTAQAEKLLDFKLPPDPKIFQEGADSRYPSKIVWSAKVANGIVGATGRRMIALGQAAILTGRPEFREKARQLALAVARDWNPDGGSNAHAGDLQASLLLQGLCWCYDGAYDLFSESELREVVNCIRVRGDQFWNWVHPFRSNESQNHPWDQAKAAGIAAATLAEAPDSAMRFDFISSLYAYRILPSLGFDGENNEGLAYWSYGLGLAVGFIDFARYAVGADLYPHPWLRQTASFPFYCAPAAGEIISFADNGRPNHGALIGPINRSFTAKLAANGGDETALWYAGYPELNGVRAKFPLGIDQSKFYPHIGLAVFNTFLPDARQNVAVGFHCGKYFAGHQHADQNSFAINAYGDRLAIDGGYYDWWGSAHFLAYSIRTIAHNTILVNGKEQAIHASGADGRTTDYFSSDDFGYVAGDASARLIYGGALTRFDRQIVFLKPDYVVIYDRLAAPEPATFSWLFHSHSEQPIKLSGSGRAFSFERPLAALSGVMLLPEKLKSKVAKSYSEIPVQGYSILKEPNPQPEWTVTIDNATPAKTMEFLSIMRIEANGVKVAALKPEKLESANAVGVKLDDLLVFFNRNAAGTPAALAGIDFDCRAGAIRFDRAGKPKNAMFRGGSHAGCRQWNFAAQSGEVGFGPPPERRVTSEPNHTLLRWAGRNVPAELHTVTLPDESKIYTLSGVIDFPESGVFLLRGSRRERPLNIIFSSPAALTATTLKPGLEQSGEIKIVKGKTLFSLTSSEPLTPMELDGSKIEFIACTEYPADYAPPEGAVKVEAEAWLRVNRSTSVLELGGASGGKAQQGWNAEDRITDWQLPVPRSGRYRLLIRAAAEVEPVAYELRLDGKPLSDGIAGIKLGSTGGMGYESAEWRYFEIPVTLNLAAGEHLLQLSVRSGNTNLDCFVLRPE